MIKKINHLGKLIFDDWNPGICYHDLNKYFLDYPPKNYSFDEYICKPSLENKEAVQSYINILKTKTEEFGVTNDEFTYFLNRIQIEKMYQIPIGIDCFIFVIPYYLHPNNWWLEEEDWLDICWPFIGHNYNCLGNVKNHFIVKCLKAQFLMPNFRGIITHIKETVRNVRAVFGDEVAAKTYYIPLGYPTPSNFNFNHTTETFNLLFHGSYNHTDLHFFLRGGLELVEAFKQAYEQNNKLVLTIIYDRKGLFRLPIEVMNTIETHPGINYIPQRVTKSELMQELDFAHMVCCPAYHVHSATSLQSMMYGRPLLASDAWGFSEFIEHGKNGFMCPGQKSSWTDPDGTMREDYKTGNPSPELIQNLKTSILEISSDMNKYIEMAKNARESVESKYSTETRSILLGELFDKVF